MRSFFELHITPLKTIPPSSDVDVQIAAFEAYFDVALPLQYAEFLRQYNGGYPTLNAFIVSGEGPWAINHFFGISSNRDATEGLWKQTAIARSRIHGPVVPIADDGFGNLVLLNCKTESTTVDVWFHDSNSPPQKVFDSFSEFIDALQEETQVA